MFSVQTDQFVEYVSLFDPAVDDSKVDVEKYMSTRDRGLLKIKKDHEPIVWTLAPLSHYEREYVRSSIPRGADGEIVTNLLYYHTAEVGLRGVDKLPKDAPVFSTSKSGALTKVDPTFFAALPPEIAQDLGYVIWQLSTVQEDTKKK